MTFRFFSSAVSSASARCFAMISAARSPALIPRREASRCSRAIWISNFFADMRAWDRLDPFRGRGAGGHVVSVQFPTSPLWSHMSVFPARTYKKAHRHGPGAHVFAVTGTGYSLMWMEEGGEIERHAWHHGWVFAPPEDMFHQHFNTGATPARYMAMSLGSHRYPVLSRKVARKQNPELAIKDGGLQLDYEDQDPRIHRIWLAEMRQAGIESRMGKYFDETRIAAEMGA